MLARKSFFFHLLSVMSDTLNKLGNLRCEVIDADYKSAFKNLNQNETNQTFRPYKYNSTGGFN